MTDSRTKIFLLVTSLLPPITFFQFFSFNPNQGSSFLPSAHAKSSPSNTLVPEIAVGTGVSVQRDRVVIVDAGSSGSRLNLYEVIYNPAEKDSAPSVKNIYSTSVKPGLSSYANTPDKAGDSFEPLLKGVKEYAATNKIDPQNVPFYVLATAGMRLVPEEQQKKVYDDVKDFVQKNSSFNVEQVKTISGKHEGLYGWLGANLLLRNLEKSAETVGFIDMGGASTQIAFELNESELKSLNEKPSDKLNKEDVTTLNLEGKERRIFSKSFLGLGMDQARNAVDKQNGSQTCYPKNYDLPNGKKGDLSLLACEHLYKNVISGFNVLDSIPSTTDKHNFIASSAIYNAFNFIKEYAGLKDLPTDSLVNAEGIQSVCTKQWDDLKKIKDDKYLFSNCSSAVYLYSLLYNTYKIPGDKLKVQSQINNQSLDWAQGAVVYMKLKGKLDKNNKANHAQQVDNDI